MAITLKNLGGGGEPEERRHMTPTCHPSAGMDLWGTKDGRVLFVECQRCHKQLAQFVIKPPDEWDTDHPPEVPQAFKPVVGKCKCGCSHCGCEVKP